MKKCPNCDNELPENAKFCGYCGKEIVIDSTNNPSQASESPTERPKDNKVIWWVVGIIVVLAFPTLRTIAVILVIVYLLIRVISKGLENKQKILDAIPPVLGLVILIGFLWFIFHSSNLNIIPTQQTVTNQSQQFDNTVKEGNTQEIATAEQSIGQGNQNLIDIEGKDIKQVDAILGKPIYHLDSTNTIDTAVRDYYAQGRKVRVYFKVGIAQTWRVLGKEDE